MRSTNNDNRIGDSIGNRGGTPRGFCDGDGPNHRVGNRGNEPTARRPPFDPFDPNRDRTRRILMDPREWIFGRKRRCLFDARVHGTRASKKYPGSPMRRDSLSRFARRPMPVIAIASLAMCVSTGENVVVRLSDFPTEMMDNLRLLLSRLS